MNLLLDAENNSLHFHNGRDGLPIYSVLTYKKSKDGKYGWYKIATLHCKIFILNYYS